MKISTRIRYGLRTMVEIAGGTKTESVFQKDIAESQNLSNKYLDQIIHSLKIAGLIRDAKGRKSGYVVARKPEEISVYDIYRAFEPDIRFVNCLTEGFKCERQEICQARGFWAQLNNLVTCYLKSVTLRDVIDRKIGFEDVGFFDNIRKCEAEMKNL